MCGAEGVRCLTLKVELHQGGTQEVLAGLDRVTDCFVLPTEPFLKLSTYLGVAVTFPRSNHAIHGSPSLVTLRGVDSMASFDVVVHQRVRLTLS